MGQVNSDESFDASVDHCLEQGADQSQRPSHSVDHFLEEGAEQVSTQVRPLDAQDPSSSITDRSQRPSQSVDDFVEESADSTQSLGDTLDPSNSIALRLNEGEFSALILPFLLPTSWRAIGSACRADLEAVLPTHQRAAQLAHTRTLRELVCSREVAAAALRLWQLSGIDAGELTMPKLVHAIYAWAHYGKASGRGPRRRRTEHLAVLLSEVAPAPGEPARGIQATMRSELGMVQAAVELAVAMGRSIDQVDVLPMMPSDMAGKLEGRQGVICSRRREDTEATALMWSTRQGVRWVEMFLKLGADPNQATPEGWTALLYGSLFQSRGITVDGSTDSNDQYGGMRNRPRGVIGPLVDAGAVPTATLPRERFLASAAPSPVADEVVGPVEVARAESLAITGWAKDLLSWRARPPTA